MYPLHLLSLFQPGPRDNSVFVAMSFSGRFLPRWEGVIRPAIEELRSGDHALHAHRVDMSSVGDAVLTEIVQGISKARLVLADISTMVRVDETPFRSGNVLYEIGIAHAVRQPQEVLLFRSDHDELPFDVSGIRVKNYDPDGNPEAARDVVTQALISALREADLTRHFAIDKALDALDGTCLQLLLAATGLGIPHPESNTVSEALANSTVLASLSRLLEMGLLKAEYSGELLTTGISEREMPYRTSLTYHLTDFGMYARSAALKRAGILDLTIKHMQEQLARQKGQTAGPESPSPASP